MLRAEDVANYFLANQDARRGGSISNLKLQKLCYYAQGICLAVLERPMFLDHIEHWQHGPVVRTLYGRYQPFGSKALTPPDNLNLQLYDPETKDLLDKVYQLYGQDSAWELRNKTHAEDPWLNTPEGSPISHKQMRAYFQSLPSLYEDFGEPDRESLRHFPEIPQVMSDLKKGMKEFKSGRMVAWDEVKEELDIE